MGCLGMNRGNDRRVSGGNAAGEALAAQQRKAYGPECQRSLAVSVTVASGGTAAESASRPSLSWSEVKNAWNTLINRVPLGIPGNSGAWNISV